MSKRILVLMLLLAAVVPVHAAVAPLWNAGFETGTFEGWWTYEADPNNQNISIVGSPVYQGSYAAQIYTGNGSTAKVGQTVAAAAGDQITVGLSYYVPSGSWNGAGINVVYLDSTWAQIVIESVYQYGWAQMYNYGSSGGGSDSWQTFTASSGEGVWTAPVGTAYIDFQICQWGWTNGATYDNAVITPEPTTMVMLGLGGLALIRRKRA